MTQKKKASKANTIPDPFKTLDVRDVTPNYIQSIYTDDEIKAKSRCIKKKREIASYTECGYEPRVKMPVKECRRIRDAVLNNPKAEIAINVDNGYRYSCATVYQYEEHPETKLQTVRRLVNETKTEVKQKKKKADAEAKKKAEEERRKREHEKFLASANAVTMDLSD